MLKIDEASIFKLKSGIVATTINANKVWKTGKMIFLMVIAVFFATIIAFSSFYLISSHDQLADWYLGLNSCFYRAQYWNTSFFTKGIKSDGNMYCLLALSIALTVLYNIFQLCKRKPIPKNHFIITIRFCDVLLMVIIFLFAFIFWRIGNMNAAPAFDEIFSAQNAAGIHPFQCVSYYMLPNNHIFFNLLNNLLFHAADDKVFTGRIISFIAWYSFMIVSFFWFKSLVHNRWLAFIVSFTLAIQFQVWGFSFQARGYELYLLCEWGAFISLFSYLRFAYKRWIPLLILCTVTGYFCMPSFLYFHAAQLLFVFLYQLLYKKRDLSFWKYQLLIIAFCFLCYLPVLCFSGMAAITNNAYVVPVHICKTTADFWKWMWPNLLPYLTHLFSDIHLGTYSLNLVLFVTPLLLLLSRKNKMNVLFGLFYLSLWLTFFVIAIAMKRFPFERNLIGHYSFSLAGVILVAYWLTSFQLTRIPNLLRLTIFPALLILLATHFIRTNKTLLKDTLYDYEVNRYYNTFKSGINVIPKGSTVGFSDESFYCYYLCKKNACKVNKCSTGADEYYVKQKWELIDVPFLNSYTLVKNIDDIYDIYKRN